MASADTAFLPSAHGWKFDNAFPDGPALTVNLGLTSLGVGNAARGLCGGMVFAALDYWTLGRPTPDVTEPPAPGSPLFRYLVRRLIDSWRLPVGPLTYLALMQPLYPDHDLVVGPFSLAGSARRMRTREWPAVRRAIDAGRPCPLGLVMISSPRPQDIGDNHQVLAYRYRQVGIEVEVGVYDPNRAGADDALLTFDVADPTRSTPVVLAGPGGERPVRSFFAVRYTPAVPPLASLPGRP